MGNNEGFIISLRVRQRELNPQLCPSNAMPGDQPSRSLRHLSVEQYVRKTVRIQCWCIQHRSSRAILKNRIFYK